VAKVSLFRKIKLYLQYSQIVSSNKVALGEANIRVDMVDRLYTVVNVPEELFEGVYDTRKSDIARISQSYITEYLKNTRRMLDSMGLSELYKTYDTRKVDKYSFLIVIGFSLLDTRKVANYLIAFSVLSAVIGLLWFIYITIN
jgi:hypothetical protein